MGAYQRACPPRVSAETRLILTGSDRVRRTAAGGARRSAHAIRGNLKGTRGKQLKGAIENSPVMFGR